jgi:hypothetical protein
MSTVRQSHCGQLSRSLVVAVCLASSGCPGSGVDAGNTVFTGPGTRELTVRIPEATTVHFDTTVEVEVPNSSDASINDEWRYTIAVRRGGRVVRTVTCDALNVGPGLSSSQTGHTLKLSRSRLLGCELALDAGASTLHIELAPMRPTGVTPTRVQLFVMR